MNNELNKFQILLRIALCTHIQPVVYHAAPRLVYQLTLELLSNCRTHRRPEMLFRRFAERDFAEPVQIGTPKADNFRLLLFAAIVQFAFRAQLLLVLQNRLLGALQFLLDDLDLLTNIVLGVQYCLHIFFFLLLEIGLVSKAHRGQLSRMRK